LNSIQKGKEIKGICSRIHHLLFCSDTQFYRIRLEQPLPPKAQQTLGITFSYLSALHPLPKNIGQQETQFLVYEFSAYCPSAYVTLKQKTEVKFPSGNVPEYTVVAGGDAESPQKAGSKFTYGSFGEVPAGAFEPVKVRYEFTKPLIHVSRLERDIEVSHWAQSCCQPHQAIRSCAMGISAILQPSVYSNQRAQVSTQGWKLGPLLHRRDRKCVHLEIPK